MYNNSVAYGVQNYAMRMGLHMQIRNLRGGIPASASVLVNDFPPFFVCSLYSFRTRNQTNDNTATLPSTNDKKALFHH